MSGPLLSERQDGLAVLTFAAPPLNLFDEVMMGALGQAVAELAAAPPRALLVRAQGKVVSGGVDVGRVFDGVDAAAAEALWQRWFEVVHALERLPLPTVFAAHALCLTAAFEIALACDLLIAAQSARFGLVEKVVGLTPSMGGPQRLAARAGGARAKELVMTGDLYGAETLMEWGVVNRVLPDEGFDQAALEFTRALAVGPTLAHAATKTLIDTAVSDCVHAADMSTPAVSGALFATEDLRGAVRSFIDDGPGRAHFNGL